MRSRVLVGIAAAGLVITGCQGLKEALTAHVDVVAKAGSQELSVDRLGDLLGNAKIQVPVTRETAVILADIWTGYQQLAYAAAHNDSLKDKAAIDMAVAPMINVQKLQRFMDSIQKTFKVDSGSEASYNQAVGGLLGARHILIGFKNPSVPATQAEKDEAKKKADAIRAQVTPANFADMAKKNSTEPNAAQSGGSLGVFQRNAMIPAFSNAVMALKPGEISQPVETNFGYHIIYRLPYAEAKNDFAAQYGQVATHIADSTYMAQLSNDANVQVKPGAPATLKTVVKEQDKHRDDKGVLATYKGGELTVADILGWLETFPPNQQIAQRIPQAADSLLMPFIKQMAVQEVLLARADSAKIDIPAQDRTNMYTQLGDLVTNVWGALGVDPKMLADSAKSTAEKERLAASRADAYLDRMMAGQAQPISAPLPLKKMLDKKYEASVNQQGIDRALERATRLRASADSAKGANQPKSAIPLPGGAPPAGPPGAQPPATQPPPADTKKP
jgi:peptidyl-prolyl cis-trans isomerase D